MKLTHLTALELGRAIAAGDVTIPQATQAALEAISARDKGLNSCITVLAEQAMERAEALQKGLKPGLSPLYGVPLLLKDNLCTQGVKTTCGSRVLEGYVPPYDATVVFSLSSPLSRAGPQAHSIQPQVLAVLALVYNPPVCSHPPQQPGEAGVQWTRPQ